MREEPAPLEGEYASAAWQTSAAEEQRLAQEAQITGVPADELSDEDLLRELASVHRTRHETLRHGSEQALVHHDERMLELEDEYLRRFPQREVDPQRLTEGARTR
jgi:hypothetical protein